MKKLYRIIDESDNSIVANGITELENALEIRRLYTIEYPHTEFTVVSYTRKFNADGTVYNK